MRCGGGGGGGGGEVNGKTKGIRFFYIDILMALLNSIFSSTYHTICKPVINYMPLGKQINICKQINILKPIWNFDHQIARHCVKLNRCSFIARPIIKETHYVIKSISNHL